MARKTTSTTKATPRKKTSTARKELPSATTVKLQKPMFRTGTWITLLLLAALIGFASYLKWEKETTAIDTTPTSEETAYVFASTAGIVSSIEIKPADADGESVRITRNEQNVWAIELPLEAEADQGLAEAAATQISALKVISPIDGKPDIFGLDHPAYTVTIEFAGGTPALAGGAREKHTLEIGDSTPTNSGYYVRIDKDKMMITDLSGIDSLLQLVNFPPYLNTPTPTPLPPTETPVPPTEARGASTPEATVTPTP
jgi:hypothetical protein